MSEPTVDDAHRGGSDVGTGPKVLFVSHEASRTGAPIMFLHFLRWLRANTTLDFEVLLLAGGPLTEQFEAVATTHRVEALGHGSASYFEAGLAKAGFPRVSDRVKVERAQRSVRHLHGFDVLYLNSTTSALALRILPELPPIVVSHVHELDSAFSYWFPEQDRNAMLEATDWFVACADAVGRNLIGGHGVLRDKVSCHYEFIDPPEADPERGRQLREQFGIPVDAPLVGGSGMVIWRKGPDLFVQAAAEVVRRHPGLDVHFIWVGGPGDEQIPVEQDIAKLGLAGRVHFVGELTAPADLFAELDVFCLTSREDPYPLVMLEAAALGVPVVSFANGGAVEFAGTARTSRTPDDDLDPDRLDLVLGPDPESSVGEPRAVIVPYLDVEAMGAAVGDLLDDHAERASVAKRGQQRVLDEHTIAVGAAALHRELMSRIGHPLHDDRLDPGPVDHDHAIDLLGPTSPVELAVPAPALPLPMVER